MPALRPMFSFLAAALALAAGAGAQAQVAVPIVVAPEHGASPADGRWRGSGGAAATLASGNTDGAAVSLNIDAVRATRRDRVTLGGTLNYGRSEVDGERETTADRWSASGRYDYNLGPHAFVYGWALIEATGSSSSTAATASTPAWAGNSSTTRTPASASSPASAVSSTAIPTSRASTAAAARVSRAPRWRWARSPATA